jgi:hypothetical protein
MRTALHRYPAGGCRLTRRRSPLRDLEYEFDVALSLAGEDRGYVERVAEILDSC